MEDVMALFEKYTKNQEEWTTLEHSLMDNMPKAEWTEALVKACYRKKQLFHENSEIIRKAHAFFESCFSEDGVNSARLEELYNGVLSQYMSANADYSMNLDFFLHLYEYRDAIADPEKRAHIGNAINFCMIALNNAEYRGESIGLEYNDENRKLLDDIVSLDPGMRLRAVVATYYYITIGIDRGAVSVRDGFREYYHFMDVMYSPEVQEVMAEDLTCKNLVGIVRNTMLLSILRINDMDGEEKRIFCDYAKEYLEEIRQNCHSDYELKPEAYGSLIYLRYLNHEITPKEGFQAFLSYVKYIEKMLDDAENVTEELVVNVVNAVIILTRIASNVKDEALYREMGDVFLKFAEAKWVRGNDRYLVIINEMLGRVCTSVFAFPIPGVDRLKTFLQLIIHRDLNVFIHSRITYKITNALYYEIVQKLPDYFAQVDIPASSIRSYIENGAKIMDVGNTTIFGATMIRHRSMNERDIESFHRHVDCGDKIFQDIPEMTLYSDVIMGHHKSYDGKSGFPAGYDNTKSPKKAIVDVIALAVAIETMSDNYLQFEEAPMGMQELMERLEQGKGTLYSPELVDLIIESNVLRDEIERICYVDRVTEMYSVYHNWERIQLAQDAYSLISDFSNSLTDFSAEENRQKAMTLLPVLEKIIAEHDSEDIIAQACFQVHRFYLKTGDFAQAKALELKTVQFLARTNNMQLLAIFYNSLAFVAIQKGNVEEAMDKHLMAIQVAENIPECRLTILDAYTNIAYIYMGVKAYHKSIEYLSKAEAIVDPHTEEQMNVLCGLGYGYYKLGDLDKLKHYRNLIKAAFEQDTEMPPFCYHSYMASFADALGEALICEYHLEEVKKHPITENLDLYSNELYMHLDLLQKLHRFEELAQLADRYLETVVKTMPYSDLHVKLIVYRMRSATMMGDYGATIHFGKFFDEAAAGTVIKKGERLETLEEEFIKNAETRIQNMTIEKENRALEVSIREAQNASRQKTAFLSSMSHEIRTPIHAIIGFNEMILRESKDSAVLQYATDIQNASKQLMGIINDVLDFSKIEAGKMEIVPGNYSLKSLVKDVRNLFASRMAEKKLEYQIHCDENIPDALYGDEIRIKQIMTNLISNAYKYTNQGTVDVTFGYEKCDDQSIKLRVEVKDTGIGMKPEEIINLEKPFERLDLQKNRTIEGTGLGISIVTNLLKQMSSKLKVQSEYGKGSAFSFSLPQQVVNWKAIGKMEEDAPKSKSASVGSFYAPKAEVLVVDDTSTNLKVIKGLLKRTGMQVTTALSGKECLEICERQGFHVILMDHMMPEMDGIETFHELRKLSGPNENTPVIALTANAIRGAEEMYRKEGFAAFLAKPINVQELEKVLKSFLPKYLLES